MQSFKSEGWRLEKNKKHNSFNQALKYNGKLLHLSNVKLDGLVHPLLLAPCALALARMEQIINLTWSNFNYSFSNTDTHKIPLFLLKKLDYMPGLHHSILAH